MQVKAGLGVLLTGGVGGVLPTGGHVLLPHEHRVARRSWGTGQARLQMFP